MKLKRFDDKFVNGFIAGIIAFLVTAPLGFLTTYLELVELDLAAFAGILALGKVPESLAENIFSTVVDFMISGALGIVFAFLVPYIGSRYLWFKGWFLLGAFFFIYYPVISIGVLGKIVINVQSHVINGIIAGLFGIVLAQAYYWLHGDIQVKKRDTKDVRNKDLGKNEFQEEIAAPIAAPPPAWSVSKGLKVTGVTADSVTLKWPPVDDKHMHIKYRIFANSVSVGETEKNTFTVSSLEADTSYTFSVVAEDEAGNSTEFPKAIKVRTRRH